jgi:hypothetical protein
MASNGRWLELQFYPRRKKGGCGVFIERIAQTVGLRNRL